jgi:transcriptional regulator with XRE-family HTH domain
MAERPRPGVRRSFGLLLRRWRSQRRVSQLALAAQARVSARHLSFLETGKAQPSREMVQRLAAVLEVPLNDQNGFFIAAGYAPVYAERELGAPELEHARRALEFILRQQEPYPAFVVDGVWNIRMRNAAANRIFGLFQARESTDLDDNAMRAIFRPHGLRRYIVNWEEFAGAMIQTIHSEEASGIHPGTAQLRRELLSYPGVPERWHTPDPLAPLPALITLQLRKRERALAFFSTITTFAKPRDITLQQLRIECMHPADDATAELAHRLRAAAAKSGTGG